MRFGDFLGALAESSDQFAAIVLHGVVEFGDVAGDQVAERCWSRARSSR